MNARIRILVLVAALVGLDGCSYTPMRPPAWAPTTPTQPSAFGEHTPQVSCMRRLLEPFEASPRNFGVVSFDDQTGRSVLTGEIPAGMRIAAITALVHLGPAVRALNLDVNVYNMLAISGVPVESFAKPQYLINGAVIGFDADVRGEQRRRAFDFLFGGGSVESDVAETQSGAWSFSELTLTAAVASVDNVSAVKGSATFKAKLMRTVDEGERAYGVGPAGASQGIRQRYVQGGHSAVQHSIQLAMIKLVGQVFEVPFWRCAPELATFGSHVGDDAAERKQVTVRSDRQYAITGSLTEESEILVDGRQLQLPEVAKGRVTISMRHPERGDLAFRLTSPDGRQQWFKPRVVGRQGEIVVLAYDIQPTVASITGSWRLFVNDLRPGPNVVLAGWAVHFTEPAFMKAVRDGIAD